MRRGLLAAAGVVVAVLVVAQLALPGYAASRLRSDLRRHGTAVSVEVHAFPAIELLWHRADRVAVTIAHYTTGGAGSGASLADLLARTKDAGRLDVHVRLLDAHLLRIRDLSLHKAGDRLSAQVRLRRAEVDDALPPHLRVAAHEIGGSQLSVAGQTSVFGSHLAARARILLDRGRIVLRPDGIPLASLVTVPIFSDPRVAVDALDAHRITGGFVVSARGHLT